MPKPEEVTKLQTLVNDALRLKQQTNGNSKQFVGPLQEIHGTIGNMQLDYDWDRRWLEYLIDRRLDEAGLQTNPSLTINVACLIYEALPALRTRKPPL